MVAAPVGRPLHRALDGASGARTTEPGRGRRPGQAGHPPALAGRATPSATSTSILRDKVDAGARRRRLAEERPAPRPCSPAPSTSWRRAVLREGVQHADFTGLLEAIGRAHARREAAAADLEAAETLQQNEATRLGALGRPPRPNGRPTTGPAATPTRSCAAPPRIANTAGARLTRREGRAGARRRARWAATRGARRGPRSWRMTPSGSPTSSARWRSDSSGSIASWPICATIRRTRVTAAAAAKAKLEAAAPRGATPPPRWAASIAGRQRDRADAEKRGGGADRAAGPDGRRDPGAAGRRCSRPTRTSIASPTRSPIAARRSPPSSRCQAHYDQRKLLTGVGLLTSMLMATAAALWAAFR